MASSFLVLVWWGRERERESEAMLFVNTRRIEGDRLLFRGELNGNKARFEREREREKKKHGIKQREVTSYKEQMQNKKKKKRFKKMRGVQ